LVLQNELFEQRRFEKYLKIFFIMENIDLLPQRIYRFNYPNVDELAQIKQNIINEEYRKGAFNYQSTNTFLHRDTRYANLFFWIESCLDKIKNLHQYQCDYLKVSQAWSNRTSTNESHHPHSHPNSIVSGIFYLTSGSSTIFENNNRWYVGHPSGMFENYLRISYDENILNMESLNSNPGQLLLFPSIFPHRVAKNDSVNDRYTISINSFPSGIVGDPTGLNGGYFNVL